MAHGVCNDLNKLPKGTFIWYECKSKVNRRLRRNKVRIERKSTKCKRGTTESRAKNNYGVDYDPTN